MHVILGSAELFLEHSCADLKDADVLFLNSSLKPDLLPVLVTCIQTTSDWYAFWQASLIDQY